MIRESVLDYRPRETRELQGRTVRPIIVPAYKVRRQWRERGQRISEYFASRARWVDLRPDAASSADGISAGPKTLD